MCIIADMVYSTVFINLSTNVYMYSMYVCMYVLCNKIFHIYLITVPIPHGIGVETSITEHQQFHPCIKI